MKWYKKIYLGLVLAFMYAPVLMIIVFSFSEGKSRANFGGFSLRWYKELFTSSDIGEALYVTIIIAVLASIISGAIGTIAAVGIFGLGKKPRNLVLNISYFPIINPDIVTGISLMILFVFLKFKLGFVTMLLAHIAFDIPYVIFSVTPKLKQMNPYTYEAALDLGASQWEAFYKVVIPQILPGIITGMILAFTLSIDDFIISFFTTSGVQNLSIYIYSTARRGIEPSLYALMSIMFIVVFALMFAVGRRLFINSDD